MKNTTGTRKQNRTHEDIRDDLNQRIAKHHMQITQLEKRIAALDEPRKPRTARIGMNKAMAEIKAAGITPEELLKILAERQAVNA